jgi:hypothetical protein
VHRMNHGVENGVGCRSLEPKGRESLMEQLVPFTRGLLQPIYALERLHDSRCPILVPSSWRMQILSCKSAEKRRFDVRCVHMHVLLGNDGEGSAQSAQFDKWGERLRVVHYSSLIESIGN